MESKIKVGMKVRSWDHERFPGRPDRYVEGYVTKAERGTLIISVVKDTCFPENYRSEVACPNENTVFSWWEGPRLEILEEN